jgi:hypothetical protein
MINEIKQRQEEEKEMLLLDHIRMVKDMKVPDRVNVVVPDERDIEEQYQ